MVHIVIGDNNKGKRAVVFYNMTALFVLIIDWTNNNYQFNNIDT